MLTAERLRELLHYDPATGHFTWLVQRGGTARVGSRAGCTCVDARITRRRLNVDRVLHQESRLAWLYMTGTWPEHEVDHIDRDPCNTKWSNLRAATRKQNIENSVHPLGASGVRGVRWQRGGWSARITHHRREIHLGRFERIEDAAEFRELARDMLYTHHRPEAR